MTKKSKDQKTNAEIFLSKEDISELLHYFPHLKVEEIKVFATTPQNARILLLLLNELKDCILRNKCESLYHEIPYFELDAQNNLSLVIKRELCKKTKSKLQSKLWKNRFLLDDYSGSVYNDLAETYKEIRRELPGEVMERLFRKITKPVIKSDDIAKFSLINKKPEPLETLAHEYAISVAKQGFFVSYINLINFATVFKNKYWDAKAYEKYSNSFRNSDLLILESIDTLPMDENLWANIYTIFTEITKSNKKIIIISSTDLQQIINNTFDSTKNTNIFALVRKNIQLLKKYFELE